MKLLSLLIAETCADFSNNWVKYDDAHILEMFDKIKRCCHPPMDKLSTAELLAVHSVTSGRHCWHAMLLRWVIMPDFDFADSPDALSHQPESLLRDTDHTAAEPGHVEPSQSKITADAESSSRDVVPRQNTTDHTEGPW